MNRSRLMAVLVLGGVSIATGAFALQPRPVSPGQAEQTCREHGVQPQSAAWELCLSHVTRAYEWGEQTLASQLARAAGEGRMSCLERGLRPETQGYRACINREIDARSDLLILGDDQSGVNVAQAQQ